MDALVPRIIVNVFALLFLSVLLLGSVSFSQTLLTFETQDNYKVTINDFSFGRFLKVEPQATQTKVQEFRIVYQAFPQRQALYRGIVEVKNTSATSQTLKIYFSGKESARLYFEENQDGDTITLEPGEPASISLIANESQGEENESKEMTFSLRRD